MEILAILQFKGNLAENLVYWSKATAVLSGLVVGGWEL